MSSKYSNKCELRAPIAPSSVSGLSHAETFRASPKRGAVRCLKPKRDSQHILLHLLSLSLETKTRSSAVSQAEAGLATHSPPSPLSLPRNQDEEQCGVSSRSGTRNTFSSISSLPRNQDEEQCGVSSRSGTRNTFSSISSLSPSKPRRGAVRCLKPKRDSQHILLHLLSLSLETKTRSSAVSQAEAGLATHSPPSPLSLPRNQDEEQCGVSSRSGTRNTFSSISSLSLETKTRSSAVSQAEAGLATHSPPSPLSLPRNQDEEQCGVSSRSGIRNTFSSLVILLLSFFSLILFLFFLSVPFQFLF
ncbi:hypothetical protein BLNAU_12841 [Blattamonas nauphoetae]|uniref:Transmembrane protein n=1 Tax=Blattamonas nauphoetae TaxID=2049346 RepID=A0ABQ9XIN1_9EUKA|nr:hypothetical protein BLNAU_12841 [Blattamonas nauphoetae]